MAIIHFQFPIKSAHGRFEKDGMVFKKLNDTKFTCNYRKSSLPPTERQLTAREQFGKIQVRMAIILNDTSLSEQLRTEYSAQSKYTTFKKFLWHYVGVELGYYKN